mgnify:CR=1 FL=1
MGMTGDDKDRGFNVLWILLALLKGKMIKYSDSESVSESVLADELFELLPN